ncbi:glutenin, low molecular weight subunit-like isoform X2 [Rosa rugosa]|uniref:glutenin, low molecular weight subunit-like isoform X2 n=1 Tax=Rosa rugosa TaxID=74645 RepID=UPI002B411032|nr:glutenin, low molecular weight subunit-like isoform X2 [Rosa rugosa]
MQKLVLYTIYFEVSLTNLSLNSDLIPLFEKSSTVSDTNHSTGFLVIPMKYAEEQSPRDIETGPTPVDTSLKADQQQQQQLFYQQQQHSYQQMMSQPCYEQYQPSFQQPQPHYQQLHPSYKQPQPCYEHYQPFFQQPQPPYQQLHPSYMQLQPQYQQQNPSYMQPPPPIHQVPYSLKMFWNEYFKISTFGISFVIILLGNIILFLKAL